MIQKLPTFLLLFFLYQIAIAQSNRVLINGSIKNVALKPIENTHVVNLTTGVGTVTNKNGAFNIPVKEGDWLQISNIQFRTKKIKVKKGNLKERVLLIYLIAIENKIEEVVIKKKLKGHLALDKLKTKKDTIGDQMKSMMEMIKDMGHEAIMNMKVGSDELHLKKSRNAQLITDPVAKFAGLPPKTIGIKDGALEAKRARRRSINFKESFPNKLIQLFGERFFLINLKIPEDKFYHFLQFCDTFGIEKLFKDGKHIELLKILMRESKTYLIQIENNKK